MMVATQVAGRTGNLPVPGGNLPRGRRKSSVIFAPSLARCRASPFRRAGSPAAQAGSPCHPFDLGVRD